MSLLDPKVNVAGFASMLGTKYDPTRGHVGVKATDCNGQPATKNVVITWLDRDDQTAATPYFIYSGAAHAINLPINAAGLTRITARVAGTNQLLSTTSIVVRPGSGSFASATPTP